VSALDIGTSSFGISIFYADIKQSTFDDAGDIEMKRNEIYGQLPQQQVARKLAKLEQTLTLH